VLELTDEVYAPVGRANCREIRCGDERIQQIDDRYVLLECLAGQSGEPDCLRVIRRVPRSEAPDFTDLPKPQMLIR
jgi:hypothetical protein